MKKIPIYVESKNGHDIMNVPENEVKDEVEKLLKDDKWVTTEKEDGNTEILTEQDIPKENSIKTITETVTKTDEQEWADKFSKVKSATATNKAKGG